MATRVNPKLIDELQAFGREDLSKCYQCGNCSATCSLSREPHIFPRPAMRALQMGLEKKLESSLDPWLCYYCGECTEESPRGADPGETMMSLRPWLTSRYDWTGVSRMFYRWGISEIIAVFVVGALTVLGFAVWGSARGDINYYDGPNAFLPMEGIHIFDLSMRVSDRALMSADVEDDFIDAGEHGGRDFVPGQGGFHFAFADLEVGKVRGDDEGGFDALDVGGQAAGPVKFADGEFQRAGFLAAVEFVLLHDGTEVDDRLDGALAEGGRIADDEAASVVLDGAGEDFGGGRADAAGEDDERAIEQDGGIGVAQGADHAAAVDGLDDRP